MDIQLRGLFGELRGAEASLSIRVPKVQSVRNFQNNLEFESEGPRMAFQGVFLFFLPS